MRQLLWTTLQADADLFSEMPAPPGEPGQVRLYEQSVLGSHGIPAKPSFPFAVAAAQPYRNARLDKAQRAGTSTFQVYVYDEHGTGYVRIERILLRMRDTLLTCVGQQSPSGAWCQGVEFLGLSVDSRDPEYVANMKFGTFAMTACK